MKYEKRSDYFKALFKQLDIEFTLKDDGSIESSHVLKHQGKKLKAYFNEANTKTGVYFALNCSHYKAFSSEHWLEARNKRQEEGYFKRVPYPGEEYKALQALLEFNGH